MKLMIVFVGLLTILGGAWPFLVQSNLIPEVLKVIPSSGIFYQLIIIAIGIIAVWYGISKHKGL